MMMMIVWLLDEEGRKEEGNKTKRNETQRLGDGEEEKEEDEEEESSGKKLDSWGLLKQKWGFFLIAWKKRKKSLF